MYNVRRPPAHRGGEREGLARGCDRRAHAGLALQQHEVQRPRLLRDLVRVAATPAEIVLIDNGGVDAISGAFDSVSITGASGYTLNYAGGDGNDLTVVIPEPGTLVLMAGGLLGLAASRPARRRR